MKEQGILYVTSIYAAKSAIMLIGVLVMYRLLGKRDLGQYNAYDLVTIIALSNAAQNGMTGGRGELWIGLGSSTALLLTGFLLARLFVWKPSVQRMVLGSPVLLASSGKVLFDKLHREHITLDELEAAMRSHGLESIEEVSMAVLEVDGSISIVPASDGRLTDAKLF